MDRTKAEQRPFSQINAPKPSISGYNAHHLHVSLGASVSCQHGSYIGSLLSQLLFAGLQQGLLLLESS